MNVYFLRLGRAFRCLAGGDEMICAGDSPQACFRQAKGIVEGLAKEHGYSEAFESGDITSMNPIDPDDVAFFNRRWFDRVSG